MIIPQTPAYWLTVGDAFFCFLASEAAGVRTYESDVYEEATIKSIGITPVVSESKIFASGKVYDIIRSKQGAAIALAVVALSPNIENKALGVTVSGPYAYDKNVDINKEFAFGYWADLKDGTKVYYWHPRCVLTPAENTLGTSTEETGDPEVTYTVTALPCAANGVWRVRYFTGLATGTPLTAAQFFAAPVYTEDAAAASQVNYANIIPIAALPTTGQDATAIYVLTAVDGAKEEGTMWRYVDSAWVEYVNAE
jgi:phi13 family phage major tail protein